jgi:hypothetical protein
MYPSCLPSFSVRPELVDEYGKALPSEVEGTLIEELRLVYIQSISQGALIFQINQLFNQHPHFILNDAGVFRPHAYHLFAYRA